jgi:hypothetical protein
LVVIVTFVPTFMCGALLRVKGVLGFLAIAGIIFIGVVVFQDFQGWRLSTGGIAALLGLFAGGKVSDFREFQRMKRAEEEGKRRRDAMMRRG